MKTLIIKKDNFKFTDLISKSLDIEDIVTAPYGVCFGNLKNFKEAIYLHGAEKVPTMEKDFTIDKICSFLAKEQENFVFVTFSSNNIGDPILCADGNEYGGECGGNEEDYEDSVLIDDDSLWGYIIRLNNEDFVIDSAIYSIGGACCEGITFADCLDIVHDAGIFDGPMQKYLKKFML